MFLIVTCVAAIYIIFSIIKALPHAFIVPPHDWRQKIENSYNNGSKLTENKKSSYRRRLITSSNNPSEYTNYNKKSVTVSPKENLNLLLSALSERDPSSPTRKIIYGFFHPYANNGGGGERVLWQAVHLTLKNDQSVAVIYISSKASPTDILKNVQNKFQINLSSERIVFIYLSKFAHLIDASYWKRFTLVGQMFGTFLLTLEAISELLPDIWIDTIGLPASYFPIKFLLKIPILSYVHYPIIQQDMFNKLNKLSVRGMVKFVYWKILYYVYVFLGSCADIAIANGTWTQNHLKKIWSLNKEINILYPPCGTENYKLSKVKKRQNKVLYISQFRPEKRHNLVLKQYKEFLKINTLPVSKIPTIVFLGSCRTTDDTTTLNELKDLVEELDLTSYVEFVVDCSYDELTAWVGKVEFGINAMWNEHFGIGVVEYLCGGAIPIVHASAGPYLDIINKDIGFFFKDTSDPDYKQGFSTLSEVLLKVSNIDKSELEEKRSGGTEVLDKFSNKTFNDKWSGYVDRLIELERNSKLSKDKVMLVY